MVDAVPQEVPAAASVPTVDERKWAVYAHRTLTWLVFVWFWSGAIMACIVLFEVFKGRSRFVCFHARQVLYLQLVIIGLIGPLWVTSKFTQLSTVNLPLRISLCASAVAGLVVWITALIASYFAGERLKEGHEFEYWCVGHWARNDCAAV